MDQRDLGRLEEAVRNLSDQLRSHVEKQDGDKGRLDKRLEEMAQQIRLVRTEHVIVKASALTIVKILVVGGGLIGGAVTVWSWIKSHVTFHP